MILLRPGLIHILLNTAGADTDSLPVQRRQILRRDLMILRSHIDMVFLIAHGTGRKQHMLCPLLLIGDIRHEIDLSLFKLF